jgi:hypothetical protein
VLFGGVSGDMTQPLSDTWTWNGTRWTRLSPANSPSGRGNAAIAYDEGRGVTVLFGGTSGFYGSLTDTWTWDGTNWTEMQPSASPPSVAGTTRMSYDAALGRVVLFTVGALPHQGRWVTQTWTWDGRDWTQLAPPASPTFPSGTAFTMTYYPPTSSLLLLTARDQGGPQHLELWAFDGKTWNALASPGDVSLPCSVFQPTTMAYDTSNASVMLSTCGTLAFPQGQPGSFRAAIYNALSWRGGSWTESTLPKETPFSNSLAYDAAHQVVVLFGSDEVPSNVVWTWDGTNWTRVG